VKKKHNKERPGGGRGNHERSGKGKEEGGSRRETGPDVKKGEIRGKGE